VTLNRLLLLGLLLGLGGWWHASRQPGRDAVPVAVDAGVRCPPPPVSHRSGPPLQSPAPEGMPPFAMPGSRLLPLAGISLQARVLSRHDYHSGREAHWSPTDLALGWEGMAHEDVLARLEIRQSGRWYHYRWEGQPPLPPSEIARSSANMHMIPADAEVARTLAAVEPGQQVRIDGWLVEVRADDGWRWRSSTRRDDTGAGACEVVYVCGIAAR